MQMRSCKALSLISVDTAYNVPAVLISFVALSPSFPRSEYANDLVRQGCDIDLTPPHAGRRAQDDVVPQKTGMSKPLQISSELCTWDSFDERVVRQVS